MCSMENSDDLTVNILSTEFECNGDGDGDVFVRFSICVGSDVSEATAFFHRLFDVIALDFVVGPVVPSIVPFVLSNMNRSRDVWGIFAFVRR